MNIISKGVAVSTATNSDVKNDIASQGLYLITYHRLILLTLLDVIMKVHIQPCRYDFDGIRVAYGNLFDIVACLLPVKVQSVQDVNTYLERIFPELRPKLAYVKSFDGMITVVRDKCTIINIHCLEAIVTRFKIVEAKDEITAYKSIVSTFCEEIKLSICYDQSFKIESPSPQLLTCETIQFVLEWEAEDHPLNDIKHLLQKAFNDKRVQVLSIKEGNSIIVTCYAPRHIMDVLIIRVKKNLDVLKDMKLIRLSISYHLIWDSCTRDKV